MKLLKKNIYYNQFGTRRSICEWEGEWTAEEFEEKAVSDAPYGYNLKVLSIDEKNMKYTGELDEYWD